MIARQAARDGLTLDVAIVGAGVSGLYTGWRLTQPGGGFWPHGVGIFDGGMRIGGRLESVVMPGLRIPGELGGMRYMTSQAIVTALIEQVFGPPLEHMDFPMGDPDHLFVYLRKQRYLASAWDTAHKNGTALTTPYALNVADVGLSADQLFNRVIYDVLMADPWVASTYAAKITQGPNPWDYTFLLTAQDWDVIKPRLVYNFPGPFNGMKVNDLGFWNLLHDRVSEEGFRFLDEAGGYYSNTINWNAAEAFPYMVGDFSSATVSYRTIVGGYDQVASQLGEAFVAKVPDGIWLGQTLRKVERAESAPARYKLTFVDWYANQAWTVWADRVVLAMPRRSLELLDPSSCIFDEPSFRHNLASVIKEPSFKILMGFEYPWWQADFGALSGHSITDLPLRQCYYFGTDPDDSHSLFLASYNDMRTTTYWTALAEVGGPYTPRPTKLHPPGTLPAEHDFQASRPLVAAVMQQVRELHTSLGQPMAIPDPFVAWYRDWTDDPYGGGYHAWKAGYDVAATMRYMRQPNPKDAIHIVGEAYSDQQGWVEGALCEAEKMLEQHFGLSRPGWIPADYYMGW